MTKTRLNRKKTLKVLNGHLNRPTSKIRRTKKLNMNKQIFLKSKNKPLMQRRRIKKRKLNS